MSNIKFLKWIRENFPLRWIGGWGDPNCSTIILNIPVFDNYAIEGFPDAKCCPLCGSNLKGDDKMRVRIVSYRTAKNMDRKFPRGMAFGYAHTDPIWGSWVKVVRVDGGFSNVLVELTEIPGVFCMVPIKCVRGKYAQKKLEEMVNENK
nr:MAG TPA: Rad50 zinc hook motif [Caudoviricetes sp.]